MLQGLAPFGHLADGRLHLVIVAQVLPPAVSALPGLHSRTRQASCLPHLHGGSPAMLHLKGYMPPASVHGNLSAPTCKQVQHKELLHMGVLQSATIPQAAESVYNGCCVMQVWKSGDSNM